MRSHTNKPLKCKLPFPEEKMQDKIVPTALMIGTRCTCKSRKLQSLKRVLHCILIPFLSLILGSALQEHFIKSCGRLLGLILFVFRGRYTKPSTGYFTIN